ncbi:acyl carrier protein NodF [Hoeflea marina]|uniref:Acyl carrier protein NodF n=1 Tax=Hoeflea marina TaxID=274592 RepID=A0A317PS61_9HYPH|nr:acyl carrier protein NodF [Hoeflea marina]
MRNQEIFETTRRIIAERAELDPASITHDTALADLDIHSLDLTEIIFDIEESFNIEVELDTVAAWEKLKTVDNIVALVAVLTGKDA